MIQLYDINHNKIDALTKYIDACIDSEIANCILDKTLSFSYPTSEDKSTRIVFDGYVRTQDDEYVIKEISFDENLKAIKCKLNLEELEEKKHSSFIMSGNITTVLTELLSGTIWSFTVVQTPTISSGSFNVDSETNVFNLCKDIAKEFDIELKFDTLNKKILIYNKIGTTSNEIITSDIQVQGDTYDLITQINATGANGITCTVTNNTYCPRTKSINWTDERYTTLETLQQAAQNKLDKLCKPLFSYSCSNIRNKNVSIGDYINIIDKNSSTKVTERAIKTKEYLNELDKYKNEFQIENARPTFQDYLNEKFNDISADADKEKQQLNSLKDKIANIENELDLTDCNEYIIDLDLLGSNTYTRSVHRYAIDWGDGTVNNEASHTYSNEDGVPRQYTIKTKDLLSDNNIKKSLVEIKQINFIPLYFPIDWVDDGTQTNATEIYKEYPELVRVGDISGKIKNLTRAFYRCPKLQYCANLHEGTENTTEMYGYCRKLKDTCKLPNTVANASKMYLGTGVEIVDGLNEGLTKADYMFCNSNVSIVDKPFPKSLTNIEGMFNYCSKLEEFDFGLLYKCTIDNGKMLFDSCTNLAIIKGSIGKIKQCNHMFSCCKISKIPDFTDDTTVEIADHMFSGIEELNDYGNGLPSTVASMKNCFAHTGVTVPLSEIPSGITNTDNLKRCYFGCEKLTDISNFTTYMETHTRTLDNYCFEECRNIANKVALAEIYPFWGINIVGVGY